VRVPFGPRALPGVVWGGGQGEVAESKLRPVLHRYDAPPLPAVLRRFVEWVADYTLAPLGAVLRLALSVESALEGETPLLAYRLTAEGEAALAGAAKTTAQRRRVMELLRDGPPRPGPELAREAGCGTGVVRGLAELGWIAPVGLDPTEPLPVLDPHRQSPVFSADQRAAAEALCAKVAARAYSASLLDGVTGAGKTEVYLEAVAECLKAGRQAVILLPEIALTGSFIDRVAARFGARPALWHSELGPRRRRQTWRAIARGEAQVVIGARSALFLPYPDLGLIVVDEEHDQAFKQEEGVVYNARDMAVVRAQLGHLPIVLVSATPSLETMVNCEGGKYERLHLPARHGGASLPHTALIDLRRERMGRQSFISPTLNAAMQETLGRGEQALLFLNRRGYAPLTLCRACGFRIRCPNCTAWLVEHRLRRCLTCHHCGHTEGMPEACPSCGVEGKLAACGPGVERIAEEVAASFPEARRIIMTSDTMAGPGAGAEALRLVREREVDIIIGTQIVAKGHHFPMLTLVGVIDADLGLAGGDLRAGERTFQVLHQVAGRAGRAERPGRVLLQTVNPEHPVMQALVKDDRDAFLAEEEAQRRDAEMPPFSRLVAIIVSGEDAERVDQVADNLARTAPHGEAEVWGPTPAPLALLRGRHRRRLLVRAPRRVAVQRLVADWLNAVPIPGNVRVQVDVDPYSFL